MNFEMLKDAIDLSANEPPTIINALCMIRTVYMNVEAEADLPLSQCPIGDGQLQKELIQISKKLLSIYTDNSDALQRNRARLDRVMEDLRTAQTELETLAESAKLLPEKEAEYQHLLQQLEAAKAAQAAYADLLSQIEASQKELAQLQRFDMDAARLQHTELLEQIRSLEDTIRSLDTQIQQKKEEKALLDGDVTAKQQELDRLQQELDRLTQQKEALQTQLDQAAQLHTTITGQISDGRTELEQLETMIRKAGQLLVELQSRLEQQRGEQSRLEEDVDRLRRQITDLNQYITNLRNELSQKLHPEYDLLTQKKQQLLEEKLWILKEISSLTAETGSLDAELLSLRSTLALRQQERDEAQKRVDDYHRDVLDPIITERDALLEREKRLLAEKESAEKKSAELKTSQQTLIQQIGTMKTQYDRDTEIYQNDKQRQQELGRKQAELTAQLNTLTDTLADQQRAYDKLEKEDLPAVQKYLADETRRLETLQTRVNGIRSECQEKTDKISQLNSELPALQEKVCDLRSVYEARTVTYTTNNQDILDLERKIKELEARNDQERLARYRAQLQERERKLVDLADDCNQIDMEVRKLDSDIDIKSKNLQILTELKKKKEDGAEGIDQLLTELKPYDTEEYRRQARSIAIQYENLLVIRSNLAQSIYDTSRCIAGYELTAQELRVQQFETILTQLTQHSRSLHHELIACAEAVMQNHIMEEPK